MSRYKVTRDGGIRIKEANDLVRALSTVSAELLAHPPKTNYWLREDGIYIQIWLDEEGVVQTRYQYSYGPHHKPQLADEVARLLTNYMPKRKEGP